MPQGRPLSEADVLELLDGNVDDLLEDEDELGKEDERDDGQVLPINLPVADGLNNSYCRVVHTNGIHYLPLVTCGCHGLEKRPADLILNGLIPASFSGSRIYFTTAVLSDYRLANLECKSSALHYWHKLCRHTAAATHPGDMDNFYRELRRLSRGWRWLKKLQWSGVGQAGKGINDVGEGELAIFCPTCPQPEINLPPDWQSDKNWKVYIRQLTADGNFKADHVRQKSGDADIWLSEGAGMMWTREKAQAFLDAAIVTKTKAPCDNQFRVIEQAMLLSKACDVTGIVAIACARHGCFAPNSLTNLTAGEQQRHVDMALLQAMKTTHMEDIRMLLLFYDIMCQYWIHLRKRIGHLLPPEESLVIERAIGLMHVHGHQRDCFPRFSPSFIPGAAIVAGEILESLWAVLNTVAPMTRTMTLAHRAEVLDDHMNDSNWKKLLDMPGVLCRKFQKAELMSTKAAAYFASLCSSIKEEHRVTWEEEIAHAESRRLVDITAMDIMHARAAEPAPSASAVVEDVHTVQQDEWIQQGLRLEAKQIEIQDKVRRLAKYPREDDQKAIETDRAALRSQLDVFVVLASKLGLAASVTHFVDDETPTNAFDDIDIKGAADPPPPTQATASLSSAEVQSSQSSRAAELRLRQSHADTLLQNLRELIAEKSFHYSHIMRVAPRKAVRTRTRTTLGRLNHQIGTLCRVYSKCRASLVRLGADERTLQRYQQLTAVDIKSSTAILEPNRPGSTTDHVLSWIWQLDGPVTDTTEGLTECKYSA
ncbi:hypothetical protein LshimejAT787_1901410 [Lyophyllum shimeji]|uniref:CxC2-like cysteine cluster KDZ transposase-associated domain-containing protein n=1 Tax=Lyophyllum shimeji TaxID=47721 RepID=A0A9P3Q0U8_LYOSH|nr:hypothetical protein LshimejAT787_1901410 [Lyophyllum shimeji]